MPVDRQQIYRSHQCRGAEKSAALSKPSTPLNPFLSSLRAPAPEGLGALTVLSQESFWKPDEVLQLWLHKIERVKLGGAVDPFHLALANRALCFRVWGLGYTGFENPLFVKTTCALVVCAGGKKCNDRPSHSTRSSNDLALGTLELEIFA